MQDNKAVLKEYKEKVDGFRTYSDELARNYVSLLNDISSYIKNINCDNNNSKLQSMLKDAIVKLKIEVRDRFDNHYYTMREKKKGDELRYSRYIVSTALKRIIKNI